MGKKGVGKAEGGGGQRERDEGRCAEDRKGKWGLKGKGERKV